MFSQAEVFLSWKSLLLNNFFKDLGSALFELKDLVEKVRSWWLCPGQNAYGMSAMTVFCLSNLFFGYNETNSSLQICSLAQKSTSTLSWSFVPFSAFFLKNLDAQGMKVISLSFFSLFPQVEYICKTKIYAVLEEISETVLIVMPEEQVCTVEYLLETNKVNILYFTFYFCWLNLQHLHSSS